MPLAQQLGTDFTPRLSDKEQLFGKLYIGSVAAFSISDVIPSGPGLLPLGISRLIAAIISSWVGGSVRMSSEGMPLAAKLSRSGLEGAGSLLS